MYRTVTLLNTEDNMAQGQANRAGQTLLNTEKTEPPRQRAEPTLPQGEDKPLVKETAGAIIDLRPGDRIRTHSGEILTVRSRIGKASETGEADVFLCAAGEKNAVIKLFRREMRNMEKKLETFRKVNSRYIAPIIDTGFYANRYFEVYHYYPWGSLAEEIAKRSFTAEELEKRIIPQLAVAINDLHQAGIYHRDIKPENILWADASRRNIVLIDFGLSSVIRDPSTQATVVVTQVGGTRAYEAPEVHDEIYVKESDYFSMGIVLYELYTQKKPVAVYTNRITRPEGMPVSLHRLILGLTYTDISNRRDKRNPNRRWIFDEIVRWSRGEDLPVPGTVLVTAEAEEPAGARSLPPFSFMETKYTDMDALCRALATDWENGKRCVLRDERNALLQHLRRYGKTSTHALWASQIDDIVNNSAYTPDLKLLRVIQTLSPEHSYAACPLGCFDTVSGFGKRLMTCMQSESKAMRDAAAGAAETLLSAGELSACASRNGHSRASVRMIREFEALVGTERWKKQREAIVCELAYMLSGETRLDPRLPDGTVFNSIDSLKKYLLQFGNGDFRGLYDISKHFLDDTNQMKPMVYGWLRRQGCGLELFNR